jgi:hypothetical protein
MLVPEKEMQDINLEMRDPTITPPNQAKPSIHVQGKTIVEEDLILYKTEKDDTSWCLAEVSKIFPDEFEVAYFTTPKPLMEGYATATLHSGSMTSFRLDFARPGSCTQANKDARWERNTKTAVPIQSQATTLDEKTTRQRDRRSSAS